MTNKEEKSVPKTEKSLARFVYQGKIALVVENWKK